MKRRLIISIYDDTLSFNDLFKILRAVDYDHRYFEKELICEMSSGHAVRFLVGKTKSIKADIWRVRRNGTER